MKDEKTGLDVASVGDAEGVAALVGLDAPTADWTPERIRGARERCETLRVAIETMTTEDGEDPAEELFQSAREADPGSGLFDAHLSMIDAHRDRVNALRGAWLAARVAAANYKALIDAAEAGGREVCDKLDDARAEIERLTAELARLGALKSAEIAPVIERFTAAFGADIPQASSGRAPADARLGNPEVRAMRGALTAVGFPVQDGESIAAAFARAWEWCVKGSKRRPGLTEERPQSRPYIAEQRQLDRSSVYAEFEKMGQLESDVIEWLSGNYEPLRRRALEAYARASRGETGPAPSGLTRAMHDAAQRPSVAPDVEAVLAADKEYLDRLPTATELPPRDR